MGKLRDGNYILIQSFMVEELKLKGNELLVYAIIFGFSQEDNQKFNGSLQYLADWTNSTKQGVVKNLKSLIEKGYIIKEEKSINNIKFCEYYTTKFNGIKQSLTNNINNNIYNNNINNNNSIYNISTTELHTVKLPTLEEIQNYIKEKNLNVNGKQFYDYFTEMKWVDSKGNKVKNWKGKLLTWNSYKQPLKEVKQNTLTRDFGDLSKFYMNNEEE